MSFSQATWLEGTKLMSGTICSSWIKDSFVYYPNGHAYTAVKENHIISRDNWYRFSLKSVKLSSGKNDL